MDNSSFYGNAVSLILSCHRSLACPDKMNPVIFLSQPHITGPRKWVSE